MNTKTVRRVIIVVLVVVLLSVILTTLQNSDTSPVNQVLKEEVSCLSSICTNDGTYGQNCIEFGPRIAHIYQTTDVNESGAHRMVITLNDNTCKD